MGEGQRGMHWQQQQQQGARAGFPHMMHRRGMQWMNSLNGVAGMDRMALSRWEERWGIDREACSSSNSKEQAQASRT